MRCAALDYMDQGGKFDDFVDEYAKFDRKQRETRAMGLREIMTLYKEGKVEEAKQMAEAANLLMEKNGYGPLWSLASGLIIFSGTVQFVSVSMLASGSVLMAAVTALMVAARHIFFSISMIGRYRSEGRRKWYLYYALCDETYAMLSRDAVPEGVNTSAYRLLVTLFDQSAWLAGSFVGGWIGTMLNFNSTGIDFAMTALFTTVFLEQWLNAKSRIPAVLGVAATLLCRIIFGRDLFLIPAMIIIIAVLTVMRGRIEGEGDENA